MTATAARQRLGPVKAYREDYAFAEYGLTPQQWRRAEHNILSEIKKERKRGKLKQWRP